VSPKIFFVAAVKDSPERFVADVWFLRHGMICEEMIQNRVLRSKNQGSKGRNHNPIMNSGATLSKPLPNHESFARRTCFGFAWLHEVLVGLSQIAQILSA
jgi:hypothetical protein